MKNDNLTKEENKEFSLSTYIEPQIEICDAFIEKGYASSFSSGNGNNVSINQGFEWGEEIEI